MKLIVLWHLALNGYHSLEDFRANINSMIQALRNVTFILQSSKSDLQDFYLWYSVWESKMRSNFILKELKDARNIIVKAGDLELESVGMGTLKNWENLVVTKFKFDPSIETKDVAADFLVFVKSKFAFDDRYLNRMVFELERIWIYKSIKGIEFLSVLAEAYNFMTELLLDAEKYFDIKHEHNLSLQYCSREFNSNNILKCMSVTSRSRTVTVSPTSFAIINPVDFKINFNDELILKSAERYGNIINEKWLKLLDPFFEGEFPFILMKKFFSISLGVYIIDRVLVPTFFLFKQSGECIIRPVFFKDQQEKINVIDTIAEFITREEIIAVLFVGEVWKRPFSSSEDVFIEKNRHNWDECLAAEIITKKIKKNISVPIIVNEGNDITYGSIVEYKTEEGGGGIIGPIISAIGN